MYVHIVYFRNCYRKYRFSSLYVGRTTAVVHWRKELEASLAIFDQTPTYFLPIDRVPRDVFHLHATTRIFFFAPRPIFLSSILFTLNVFSHRLSNRTSIFMLGTYLDSIESLRDRNSSIFKFSNKEK